MMDECMPPVPGGGINVTVSIDLGSLLGGCAPCPPPPKPSTSLTQMPACAKPECDPGKVRSFADGGSCFEEAKESVSERFGGKPEFKRSKHEGSSFSQEDQKEEKKKETNETKKDEKKRPW